MNSCNQFLFDSIQNLFAIVYLRTHFHCLTHFSVYVDSVEWKTKGLNVHLTSAVCSQRKTKTYVSTFASLVTCLCDAPEVCF